MKKNEASSSMGKTILYLFLWSSAYFTVIALSLLFAQWLQEESRYVIPSRFLMIYPFAIMMAVGNLIVKAKNLGLLAKTVTHYLITITSFYGFLVAPVKNGGNPFTLILVLTAVYIVIAAPIVIVFYVKNKKSNDAVPYQSQFSKKK